MHGIFMKRHSEGKVRPEMERLDVSNHFAHPGHLLRCPVRKVTMDYLKILEILWAAGGVPRCAGAGRMVRPWATENGAARPLAGCALGPRRRDNLHK